VESILTTIGNTPLVRLTACAPANGAELWAKLENTNPSGSMKDRMALAMIEGAERDGLLSLGDTVVEYTGGSTGPALALVCRARGYRALIVIADCFTVERRTAPTCASAPPSSRLGRGTTRPTSSRTRT
jgi:cysteine synthase A